MRSFAFPRHQRKQTSKSMLGSKMLVVFWPSTQDIQLQSQPLCFAATHGSADNVRVANRVRQATTQPLPDAACDHCCAYCMPAGPQSLCLCPAHLTRVTRHRTHYNCANDVVIVNKINIVRCVLAVVVSAACSCMIGPGILSNDLICLEYAKHIKAVMYHA